MTEDISGVYYPNGVRIKDISGCHYPNGQSVECREGTLVRYKIDGSYEMRGKLSIDDSTPLFPIIDFISRKENVTTFFSLNWIDGTISTIDAQCE